MGDSPTGTLTALVKRIGGSREQPFFLERFPSSSRDSTSVFLGGRGASQVQAPYIRVKAAIGSVAEFTASAYIYPSAERMEGNADARSYAPDRRGVGCN